MLLLPKPIHLLVLNARNLITLIHRNLSTLSHRQSHVEHVSYGSVTGSTSACAIALSLIDRKPDMPQHMMRHPY